MVAGGGPRFFASTAPATSASPTNPPPSAAPPQASPNAPPPAKTTNSAPAGTVPGAAPPSASPPPPPNTSSPPSPPPAATAASPPPVAASSPPAPGPPTAPPRAASAGAPPPTMTPPLPPPTSPPPAAASPPPSPPPAAAATPPPPPPGPPPQAPPPVVHPPSPPPLAPPPTAVANPPPGSPPPVVHPPSSSPPSPPPLAPPPAAVPPPPAASPPAPPPGFPPPVPSPKAGPPAPPSGFRPPGPPPATAPSLHPTAGVGPPPPRSAPPPSPPNSPPTPSPPIAPPPASPPSVAPSKSPHPPGNAFPPGGAPPPGNGSPPPPPQNKYAPPPKGSPHAPPPSGAAPPVAAGPPTLTPPAGIPPSAASSPPSTSPAVPPPPPPNAAAPPGLAAGFLPGVLSPPAPPTPGTVPSTGMAPPAPPTSGGQTTMAIGIAAGGLVGFLVLAALVMCFCWKRKRNGADANGFPYKGSGATVPLTGAQYRMDDVPDAWGMHSGSSDGKIPPPPSGSDNMGNSRSWFTFDELAAATDSYSQENLLGEGGFGRVYKGTLPNGTLVAVKQLTVGGGQGEREFRAEVEVISRVHHRHLVSLVGYCVADTQRLLVYDYVPNGTLEHALHGKDMPIMDWNTRLKIGLGCARGLAYLHEDCHPRIIHRDIKSSNILLDENYEAQVADFGLAKLSSDTRTHVSTRVMGTFGYLAPEYAASGKLTDRSDVYSFGVVLLELVTGRKPIDTRRPVGDESLVEWARPVMNQVLEDGHLEDLVDPDLDGRFDRNEMIRVIETAAACVRHSALKRPRMAQVVRALESDSDRAGLYQGMKPGQSMEYDSQFGSSDYGGGSTSRFAGAPGESGQFDTAEYNAGLRSFKKPGGGGFGGTQQFGQLTNIRSGEFAPSQSSSRSGEYHHHAAAAATSTAASSGDFDADGVGDLPGDARIDVRSDYNYNPSATSGRSAQFNLPNSAAASQGYNNNYSYRNNNNNNRSGFMGQPPPRPPNYRPPAAPFSNNNSGEYVPIGKTVQFAPSVDQRHY